MRLDILNFLEEINQKSLLKSVHVQKENPCNLLNYKDLCFFLVAGAGLEPTTFGL